MCQCALSATACLSINPALLMKTPSSEEKEYDRWGFWNSHIYLNTFLLALITLSCDWIVTNIIQLCFTPCFESQSYHFVSQHDISLCPCSVIAFTVPWRIFFFHWIGSCYFSPDDSIMHGLYFQCLLSGFERGQTAYNQKAYNELTVLTPHWTTSVFPEKYQTEASKCKPPREEFPPI